MTERWVGPWNEADQTCDVLTLVSKDSVKNSDHFDVLCVLIACMVLEIINQMSKNQKSSLIVWNTVCGVFKYKR